MRRWGENHRKSMVPFVWMSCHGPHRSGPRHPHEDVVGRRFISLWRCIGTLALLVPLLSLVSCFRIVDAKPLPTQTAVSLGPTLVAAHLTERGGATAQWSSTQVKPGFGPNSARLQIPPGGPPGVPFAYVAIRSPVATVNDIEMLAFDYFVFPHSTSDATSYIIACLDLDGDGIGCDDFVIGSGNEGMPKNQWNTKTAIRWRIVSHGFTSYTLDQVKDLVGDVSIIRIKVAVGMWGEMDGMVTCIDGLVVNGITYNLEPEPPDDESDLAGGQAPVEGEPSIRFGILGND